MSYISDLLKQAEKVQADMKNLKEELASKEFEFISDEAIVIVRMNGKQELLDIKIKKEYMDSQNKETVEKHIKFALNQVIQKSSNTLSDSMARISEALNIKRAGK